MEGRPGSGRVRSCPRCNALNGVDFDRCIRCGAALSAIAAGAERLRGRIEGRRLVATAVLLGMTTLVFAAQLRDWLSFGDLPILGPSPGTRDPYRLSLIRFGALFAAPRELIALPIEPWRLLSAVFVHGSLLHFLMNMLSLANLARVVEPAIGSARLAVAYVVTGIAGFAASALWRVVVMNDVVFTVGASGAVFGVMGLILGWLIRRRDPRWKQFAVQAVFYVVVLGMFPMINNAAHVGGLLAGVLFGLVYARAARPRRWTEPLVNAAAVISLAACVASLVLAQRSPLWRKIDEQATDRTAALAPAPRRPGMIATPPPTV
jgi:membrane associated rhomboid family serine protease